MKKLIFAFHSFANVSENCILKLEIFIVLFQLYDLLRE
jgi:hypothetical protein